MNIVLILFGIESYIHWRRSSDSVCDFECFTLKCTNYIFTKYFTLPLPPFRYDQQPKCRSYFVRNANGHISMYFPHRQIFFSIFFLKEKCFGHIFLKRKKKFMLQFSTEILTGIKYD